MKEDKLFLALLGASSAHADASRQMFASLGLTEGQPKILYILNDGDGIVQKDLANMCGVKQSTLTVLLGKMESEGYIYKEICYVSGMKRAYKVLLTEKGKEKANQLEEAVNRLEQKSLKDFSEGEREMIFKLLRKIEKNMRC